MKAATHALLLTLLLNTLPAHAQTTDASPQPTRAEVESYVKQMKTYLAKREESAARIVNQIVQLDDSLKDEVKDVLDKINSVTDSPESKTKVARIKRDVIDRIGRAAQYYANERAKLDEALRTTGNPFKREDLYKEREQFDKKIDNMVNAVVGLAASMDTHKDFEEYLYENTGGWGWGWNNGTLIRKNPEFDQNRRATSQSKTARTEVGDAIEKSLSRLKDKQAALQTQLTSGNLTEEQKEATLKEMERLTEISKNRSEQLLDVQTPEQKPTVPVSLSAAIDLEETIKSVASDARRDISSIFARYRELRTERDAIADQEARLARAEQWLKDNPNAK